MKLIILSCKTTQGEIRKFVKSLWFLAAKMRVGGPTRNNFSVHQPDQQQQQTNLLLKSLLIRPISKYMVKGKLFYKIRHMQIMTRKKPSF